jgi:hypothetical protein
MAVRADGLRNLTAPRLGDQVVVAREIVRATTEWARIRLDLGFVRGHGVALHRCIIGAMPNPPPPNQTDVTRLLTVLEALTDRLGTFEQRITNLERAPIPATEDGAYPCVFDTCEGRVSRPGQICIECVRHYLMRGDRCNTCNEPITLSNISRLDRGHCLACALVRPGDPVGPQPGGQTGCAHSGCPGEIMFARSDAPMHRYCSFHAEHVRRGGVEMLPLDAKKNLPPQPRRPTPPPPPVPKPHTAWDDVHDPKL